MKTVDSYFLVIMSRDDPYDPYERDPYLRDRYDRDPYDRRRFDDPYDR